MRLVLSASSSLDEERIRSFYTKNPHPEYAFREQLTRVTAESGNFFILQKDEDIVGVGGMFSHVSSLGKVYVEVGQDRINLNGFNLVRPLIHARLLKSFSMDDTVSVTFAQVDETNAAANGYLTSYGFEQFELPDELRALATEALPPDKREDALGVRTIYWRHQVKSRFRSRDYLRERLRGNKLYERGSAGDAEIWIADSVMDWIVRGMDE